MHPPSTPTSPQDFAPTSPAFLSGGGEMGALMRAHVWASSPLGPPPSWPQPLRAMVRLMLNTGHPMYIFWGAEGTCLYNDAYRECIGPERHPGSLGRPAREVWEEIWPIIGPQIEQVREGRGATWNVNHLVPITRHGRREDVYWTYSYSPIDDEHSLHGIGGVLVVCTETTAQVLANKRMAAERDQLGQLFEQAPSFMTLLSGPHHRFEIANPSYLKLVGNRDVVGKTLAEALPEAVEQGYQTLLDSVYTSGEAYIAKGARFSYQGSPGAPGAERFVDFVYQPIKGRDGSVTGIFVEGADVTDRETADAALRAQRGELPRAVGRADGVQPHQGRVPGHARARAAQSAGGHRQRADAAAACPPRRARARVQRPDHRAPDGADGAVDRRPAGPVAPHARHRGPAPRAAVADRGRSPGG